MVIYKYIDESCHLEHDNIPVMCIGFTGVEETEKNRIAEDIKQLKLKHHTPTELKWNKLSGSRIDFYKELIDYFFEQNIVFRCVLVKYKDQLNHNKYNEGSHDLFYYKMIYYLLKPHINGAQYRIFLDIKDTRSKFKLDRLDDFLTTQSIDKSCYKSFQHIRSEENVFIQLTDFFIGAITYKARKLHKKGKSAAIKKEIVKYLEYKSGYYIDQGTPPWEEKFNIFDFVPRKF